VLRRDFLLGLVARGERVLDLGCGLGDFTAALAAHGAWPIGCDVAQEPLRRARQRYGELQFTRSGATLPFADGSFDVVWMGEVLEHVQDGLGLLAEVGRVLRPGGRLLISTPDHGALRRLWFGLSARAFERAFDPRSDHVRFFTARSLRGLLVAVGLGEVRITKHHGVLLASAIRA
jgi:ubiquinone/menaquinone biosynthesis C-methylase UbiE